MRKMRKTTGSTRGPWTLGDLVTLAFDVSPSRAAAVKLVKHLTGDRVVYFSVR